MSTKSTILSVESEQDGLHASIDVYNECFDDTGNVYIRFHEHTGIVTFAANVCIRKDVWAAFVKKVKELE